MIFRSITAATVLLVLWSLVVSRLPPGLETGQTLWGSNLIHAQDYLYDTISPADIAIVGSSLSENLHFREIGGHRVHNLGFAGQGVFDGLNLLISSGKLPGYVLIEMNVITQGENEQFRQVMQQPMASAARYYLPALRQRNQPVGVGKGLVDYLLFAKRKPAGETPLRDRPINVASLEMKQKDYARGLPDSELKPILEDLQERVRYLEENGVAIVFYEAPVDPSLCPSPRAVAIREGVQEVFSPEAYAYIPQPDCAEYQTTDGHHLGNQSLAAYSEWLSVEVAKRLGG